MSSKAIGHVWFNGRSNIGIVMAHDPITDKPKAWITSAVGMDLEDDINHIMAWGSKFPVAEACTLIMNHGTVTDRETWDRLFFSVNQSVNDNRTQEDGC